MYLSHVCIKYIKIIDLSNSIVLIFILFYRLWFEVFLM